jgi:hypothetical protein
MRAFIVRPFGIKNEIDFDAVEKELIAPALRDAGFTGGTTIDILRAGNIRIDMFQRLLTADLVICDLSIHNANVFYELGIRHALRDKRTFLLRSDTDKFPFDLQTDRYFTYDRMKPSDSLPLLVAALRQTKNSEEQDSPVFRLLPGLKAQDRSRFLAVPLDFREEVERAAAARELGDLDLLGVEAQGFEWESEGLRLVGRAQFNLKVFEGARATWEAILKPEQSDLEANTQLGTIYQRLGDLTRSDQALKRVLSRTGLEPNDRAEAHSLLGRNAKIRWTNDWKGGASLPERQRQALESPHLDESLEAYEGAFDQDLNHFYSGLNAMAMLTIQTELVKLLPEVWEGKFEDEAEAARELSERTKRAKKLSAAVDLSIKAAEARLKREQKTDIWAEISDADLCFLTSDKPSKVTNAYRRALVDAPVFAFDAVRGQLGLYQELGLLQDNVTAVLAVLAPAQASSSAPQPASSAPQPAPAAVPTRVLLFTGHMIDAPGREEPRFPPEGEAVARQKIREEVLREQELAGGIAYGIAGGASGGDILFHEVCAELNIPTRLYLALPREQYIKESVAPAGPQWIERFNQLHRNLPPRVLGESRELPRWLQEKPDYNIWQRNNHWMLRNALTAGGDNVTLIALWDRKPTGDGLGGTSDMVQSAAERGAKTIILDTNTLFAT